VVIAKYRQLSFKISIWLAPLYGIFLFFQPQKMTLLILSVVFHELCHAFAGRLYGAKIEAIEFLPCGGRLVFDDAARLAPKNLLLVALAGPVGSLGLAFLFFDVEFMRKTNFMLASFNLLPLIPLDGGNILRALMGLCMEKRAAEKIVCAVSACGSVIMLAIFAAEYFWRGNLFVSLVIMASFIALEARNAHRDMNLKKCAARLERLADLKKEKICTAKLYLAECDTEILELLKNIKTGGCGIIMLLNKSNQIIKVFSEYELWQALERRGSRVRFGDLIKQN
jgi:stage IV sporulation protein FB